MAGAVKMSLTQPLSPVLAARARPRPRGPRGWAPESARPPRVIARAEGETKTNRASEKILEHDQRANVEESQRRAADGGETRPANADGLVDFFQQSVGLPGGYQTTRRDLLKFAALAGWLGALYVLVTRSKEDPGWRAFLREYHVGWWIQAGILIYLWRSFGYLSRALSFASPKAVLRQLLPGADPSAMAGAQSDSKARVAAFKRFIAGIEARGAGEPVSEFPAGADWLNVARPLSLSKDLRGKVVVLDFWTYCCINCMHILPDLASLEAKYKDSPVVVVGVHSAKFDNERDSGAIRNAVMRYDVAHPVVNDARMELWRDLGVSSWPTLAVVSPEGKALAMLAGEGHGRDIEDLVAAALEYYGERGMLSDRPLPIALERERDPALLQSPLRFPGKLATDLKGGRLFVSDSNNHRIVVTDLSGKYLFQIGGNGPRLQDGSFDDCAFNRPQGLAFDPRLDALYVADTENHALRLVLLSSGTVTTLLGDGTQGRDYLGGAAGRAQRLNSPWEVILAPAGPAGGAEGEARVFVAMAGSHQLWEYEPGSGVGRVFSGDGYERNRNGPNGPNTSYAQPSGLAVVPTPSSKGFELFVADSESSSVRSVNPGTGGAALRAGGDALMEDNLFDFGDRDGVGTRAKLQHPLGVCALPDGRVVVADSYNHRLKLLDPSTNEVRTLAGSGAPGLRDGRGADSQFSEPAGFALGKGSEVYVADTNNNRVRVVDVGTGAVHTLALQGVPGPKVDPASVAAMEGRAEEEGVPAGAEVVEVPAVESGKGTLAVSLRLPLGYHLTQGANSSVRASIPADVANAVSLPPGPVRLSEASGVAQATVPFEATSSATGAPVTVTAVATVYYCRDGGACLFKQIAFRVPLRPTDGRGPASVPLQFNVPQPNPV